MPPRRSTVYIGTAVVSLVLFGLLLAAGGRNIDEHPIAILTRQARLEHENRERRQPKSLKEAYNNYIRKHNGRKPPKGYDKWFWTSLKHDVCNLDQFDRMYDDLRVWSGLTGEAIRLRTEALQRVHALARFRIRKGKVVPYANMTKSERGSSNSDALISLTDMATMLLDDWGLDLPDVDMFINQLDEPRVLPDYEQVQDWLQKANSGKLHHAQLPRISFEELPDGADVSAWAQIRFSCPPTSAARRYPISLKPGEAPVISTKYTSKFQTPVGNFLYDPHMERASYCDQPDLQDLHAAFVHPLSWHVSHDMWPIFSNSKVRGFADLLIPPWFYWQDWVPYRDSDDFDWVEKRDTLYWRGSNTGGKSFGLNWIGWQRSRMMTRTNRLEEWNHFDEVLVAQPLTRPYPYSSTRNVTSKVTPVETYAKLKLPSHTLNRLTDIAFSYPDVHGEEKSLNYQRTEPSFRFTGFAPFYLAYGAKAVLDMDGTAYSGRFLALMASKSAVFKQQLFEEALGDTLVPWYHYVPLSVRANDLYNLLVYYFGAPKHDEKDAAKLKLSVADHARLDKAIDHERELKAIADQGRRWSKNCGRKEDMLSYTALLIMEWARLIGDDNERNNGFSL